jgi:hypothetical protein
MRTGLMLQRLAMLVFDNESRYLERGLQDSDFSKKMFMVDSRSSCGHSSVSGSRDANF